MRTGIVGGRDRNAPELEGLAVDSARACPSSIGGAMPKYILIESRDPFENGDIRHLYDLAGSLAKAGHPVTVFLVEDGVRAAYAGAHTFWFAELCRAGVELLADGGSLLARGISDIKLAFGVKATRPDLELDAFLEGHTPLWISDRRPRRAA